VNPHNDRYGLNTSLAKSDFYNTFFIWRGTAIAQVRIWIVATVVMAIGVGLVHTRHEIGDPIAGVSSLAVLADMLLFGWLVFRREAAGQAVMRSAAPAE
jgi:predicted membrane chloride channel (bestrophin family)